jgi:hypothetical protein
LVLPVFKQNGWVIMVKTTAEISETDACPEPLLNRRHLMRRWQHGSYPFYGRTERTGLLRPAGNDRLLRYHWHDVLLLKGGLPLTDLAEAYAVDLMHLNQVAEICCCRSSFLQAAVRKGALPVGKTGRAPRLVPAEVALWQQREWTTRQPRVNKQPRKKPPFKPDE